MLKQLVTGKPHILDDAIARNIADMDTIEPDSDKYGMLMENVEKLVRLKNEDKKSRVSPDTMAIVAGNLLGILIIVAYEQKHVMTSRGLGFVLQTNRPNI